MRCTAFAILAVIALPAFASASGKGTGPAAAEHAKLVTAVLAKLGVIPADGRMGPRTKAALEEFQHAKGLEANGHLDRKTLTALGLTGPKPSSAAGESTHMPGKPSTPIGPSQPSAERAAEPKIKHDTPTGR
jgi:peptidoglycan hydrolase-like protein with peptidoglycan-binding domain